MFHIHKQKVASVVFKGLLEKLKLIKNLTDKTLKSQEWLGWVEMKLPQIF
jgi:hypothetical protein